MLADHCDIDLLNRLKENDISAFNTLYQVYSKPLYIYLLHKLKDPDLCNDVLQDIFINVWEKRAALFVESSLKAYLFQTARFKIIDLYRRDASYQKYLAELTGYLVFDHSLADSIDNKKKLQDIERAVNGLPEKMREIFILSRYEHQSTRDIAVKTNLSPQTVKNQISKALRILRLNYITVDIALITLMFSLFRK